MTRPQDFETHEVFNQSPIFGDVNFFTTDLPLQEAVEREGGGEAVAELTEFGARTGSAKALDLGRQANECLPVLHSFDEKGRRWDFVEYHPAYHKVMAMSMTQGLHCLPWETGADGKPRPGANVIRCASSYMAAQMESGHCCPITMTNAAMPVLRLADPEVGKPWIEKILSRGYDPRFLPRDEKTAVTIGMGMTEKQGGTDVRANTSRAEPTDDGGYVITGHKWFLSAPMCDAFLVLAQAPGGLTCFLVPRFLPDGNRNAIHFQRLKNKLGNRSNASSEVEFHGAWGQRIGEEGRGVRTIMEMVTYTRLDCAVSSAGLMRLGLAVALNHARHRTVFQKKLIDQPLMARVLADMALDCEAATALAFRLARTFDHPDDPQEAAWQRLMTPVTKYWICKTGPALVYEAMECLGGNGYVEEGLMARLYREIPVNAIWEGSGNVMCLDVLRVLHKAPEALERVLADCEDAASQDPRLAIGVNLIRDLLKDPASVEANGRTLTELLAVVGAGTLLRRHAPGQIADGFLATRLVGRWRNSYGTAADKLDSQAILARHITD